jgi:hypothetical protein
MAECTAYTAIEVSGAGETQLNGTYIPYSTTEPGGEIFTSYTKDGLDSYPRIRAESVFSNNYIWVIRTLAEGSPQYHGRPTSDSFYQTTDPLNCPNEVVVWLPAGEASEQVPTVTGITGGGGAAPTFGLPAGSVALITSRFGSVANFLRLRNQGQV